MKRADMIALAERVEKAAGPDRELDAEIGAATGTQIKRDWDAPWSPRYTRSLDAAVALFPRKPETISTDPRKATAAALRARAEDMHDE